MAQHRFTKENQPPNRGRKKSGLKIFMETLKIEKPNIVLTKDDYFLLLQILLSGNKEYIINLGKNEDLPLSLKCVINAIKNDIDNGEMKVVNSLIDRLYGKAEVASTKLEVKSTSHVIDMSKLSTEQLEAIASIPIPEDEKE